MLHKIPFVFLFLFITAISANAQNNAPVTYGKYFHLQTARFMPSRLGDNPTSTVDVNIMNVSVWADNNFTSFDNVIKIASSGASTSEVESIVNGLKNNNNIGIASNIQPIGVAIKINRKSNAFRSDNPDLANYPTKDKEELFTFSFEWNERIEGNLVFSKQLAELAWYGNKRFEGQTIDLGKVGFNGSWHREFVLGFAMPLNIFLNPDIRLRIGTRLKLLQGMVGINTSKASGSFTTGTSAQGYPLNFDIDYQFNMGGIPTDENSTFNPLQSKGSGFGIDLGATFYYKEKFSGTLSILDIGGTRYNKDLQNYNNASSVTFSGINLVGGDTNNGGSILDSLSNQLKGTETKNSFSFALPTRLSLQAEYKIQGKTNKGMLYDKHTFYFTYIQGFANRNIATTKPHFALAYSFDLKTRLNVGVSTGFGGYTNFIMGSFIATRAGALRLGVGSSNVISYLFGGTGMDVSFNLGLGF